MKPMTKQRNGEVEQFLDLACLTYGNDSTERIEQARRILAARPALAEADAYTAAATASVAALDRLLGEDPRRASAAGGPRKWPPLLYLCYSRVTEQLPASDAVGAARLLLEHGADPNAHFMWDGTYRFTALTGAMGEGEGGIVSQPPHAHAWELATLLLDAGADPNDAQGLYNTIFRPDNRWLKLLLDRGLSAADRVNWKTDNPIGTLDFMLGHAVVKGFTERAALLLRHGADPRGANYYDGRSHHENALLNGFGEIAEMLVRAGAEPVELSPENRFRAACMSGDEAAARAALEHAPDALADPGTLHAAASLGNVAAVRCLLSLGADPNATAEDGTTALHQAAWNDRRAAAEVLVAHGARPLRDANHASTPAGMGQPRRQRRDAGLPPRQLPRRARSRLLRQGRGAAAVPGATSRLRHRHPAGWRLAPAPPARRHRPARSCRRRTAGGGRRPRSPRLAPPDPLRERHPPRGDGSRGPALPLSGGYRDDTPPACHSRIQAAMSR